MDNDIASCTEHLLRHELPHRDLGRNGRGSRTEHSLLGEPLYHLSLRERGSVVFWQLLLEAANQRSGGFVACRSAGDIPARSLKPRLQVVRLRPQLWTDRPTTFIGSNGVQQVVRAAEVPLDNLNLREKQAASRPEGEMAQIVGGFDAGANRLSAERRRVPSRVHESEVCTRLDG